MGNTPQSNWVYSVCTNNPDKKEDETHIYRHPSSIGKDLSTLVTKYSSIQDFFKERFEPKFSDRPILGSRLRKGDKLDEVFTFRTNAEVRAQAEAFGSGLLNLDFCPKIQEYRDYELQVVGVMSKNTVDYLINEIACVLYGITIVPIYDTLGEEAVIFSLNETKLKTCLVHPDRVEFLFRLKEAGSLPHLENLVVLESEGPVTGLRAVKGLSVLGFGEVKAAGENRREWAKVGPDSIWAFSYTSGTTGTPKGVLISHKNVLSTTLIVDEMADQAGFQDDAVYLSYLPMPHVLERVIFINVLRLNGAVGVYSGDPRALLDDVRLLAPTLFITVPRVLMKIHDGIQKQVRSLPIIVQNFFRNAVHSKLLQLHTNGSVTSSIYDPTIFRKVRNQLGGRLKLILTGSAPIDKTVVDFLKVCLSCPIIEGYGQTEASGIEIVNQPRDSEAGHIGGPSQTLEYKLVDAPDFGYFSSDCDELGNPAPRGELWVRGPGVSPGYYNNDEKNAETFTPDGWLRSGDIAVLTSHRNALKIIDRKKNLFKLQHGEYISPEKLEASYKEASAHIEDLFVYGDGQRTCLIAVLSINEKKLEKLADEAGTSPSLDDPKLKKHILGLLDTIAKAKKFNSLEKIRNVILDTRTFQEAGIVTSSMKLKRSEAAKVYKQQISEAYAEIETAE